MSVFDSLLPPRTRTERRAARGGHGHHRASWSGRSRHSLATLAEGEALERRELLSVTVTRTSLNLRFSTDPTSARPQEGEYQSFAVTNSGSETYTDVWFQATDFVPGQKVQLGSGEDGLYQLGALAPGQTKTAFIYFVATAFTAPGSLETQAYNAKAWDGRPGSPGVSQIGIEAESFEWVGQAIVDDSSAKTSSVSVAYFFGATPTSIPVVGGTMVMTVTGDVKNKPDRILYTPASSRDWPADVFELASADVTYSNPPQLAPDDIFEKPIPPASTPKDFSVVYTFNIEGTTLAPTPVTPSQYTANGEQTPLNRKFENSRLLDGVADIPAVQEATALEITKTGTTTAVAGSTTPCSYTITVTSTGALASEGVTVTDVWPPNFSAGRTYLPVGSNVTETANGFIWNIGTLAAGTSKSLTVSFKVPATTVPNDYVNTATVSSTTPNPNPKTATATTTVVNTPLTITKGPDVTVVAGTAAVQGYSIVVTNTSGFTAEGVTVADVWPLALARQAITPPGPTTITASTPTGFTWNIGTLAPSQSYTLLVNYTVPKATSPDPYTNTATVSSSTANPNAKTDIATTTVVAANLTITKGPSVTVPAGASTVQTFSIIVTNTSGFTAEGVRVVDVWPLALARQAIVPPGTTTITATTSTGFTWNIGTMAPSQSYTLAVNYTVPTATTVGVYTNTATLSSTTADPGPVTASATTTVVAVPLTITKIGDAATVTPGPGAHWYRITVTNTSTLFAAENVTVVDTWPVEFPKSPIVPPAGTSILINTPTGFTWDIGTILPGAAPLVLEVSFTVPLGTPFKLYTNTAVVSSTTQNPGQKTAVATTLVEPAATPGLIVSSDDGCNRAFVQLISATGVPFGPELRPYGNVCGGIRTTAADINGDGVDELIVAPGRGIAGPVKAYTLTGIPLPAYTFYPYGSNYRGGVELAAADVNNNGRKDIITGMSLGIGTVNVYTVIGGISLYRTFRGTPPGYAGGVRIAAADFGKYVNGVLVSPARDGKAEVVVGPNAGTQARVAIYDMSPVTPVLARTILPLGAGYQGGVTLATGDYDGDPNQVADIFVGAGIGRQSLVGVFNAQTGGQIGGTLAYFSSFSRPNAAVNVAVLDLDGDGTIDNLYGVQGLSGGGGTKGVRRVQLNVTPKVVTTLGAYVPPLRIRPINLLTVQPLTVARLLR